MFFSFDGVDGVGKSTQIQLFCNWLRGQGREIVTCRDPGGTVLGDKLRAILLDQREVPIHCRAEMLLYMASRAQLVEEVIRPALNAGRIVVSDRYLLANVVYQAHAGEGELDPGSVWMVGAVTVAGVVPNLVFLLDMPADKAAARIERSPDRMESRGLAYLERVRQGFLTEARRLPHQIKVIDADRPIETIHAEVVAAARQYLDSER
jgi:dTMP kinase